MIKIHTIIFNGCDRHITLEEAHMDNLLSDDGVLYTNTGSFEAFEVVEVERGEIPLDEDGEMDFSGGEYFVFNDGMREVFGKLYEKEHIMRIDKPKSDSEKWCEDYCDRTISLIHALLEKRCEMLQPEPQQTMVAKLIDQLSRQYDIVGDKEGELL